MKKNTKLNKFMAGSVTAALVASVVAPAVSAAENNFQDIVALDAEAQAAINALADAGVVKGYDNGTKFDPWQNVKRGQVALMLTRVAELGLDSKADTDTNFTDVTGDIELIGAVEALVNEEIASGYTDGTFKPYAQISRQHMAKLIVKAFDLELKEGAEVNITDLNEATTEMAEYIKILASHGITTQTEFNPQAPVSRYAFTLFLTRAMDAVNTAEIVEVSELETITVKEGEELVMPETVEVTYADDKTGEVAVEWNTEDVDTDVPGEYEVEGAIEGTDLTAEVKVVVEAVTPEVVDIEGVNAKTIVVEFNTAIDADTLKNAITVEKGEEAAAPGAITQELSKDGKTLTLKAEKIFKGDYTVKVPFEIVKGVNGQFLSPVNAEVTVEDNDAPELVSASSIIKNTEDGVTNITLSFDEEVTSIDAVKINGKNYSAVVKGNEATVTVDKLDATKSYDVTVVNATDAAGNVKDLQSENLDLTVDDEAPSIVDVKATGENQVVVTVDEKLANNKLELTGKVGTFTNNIVKSVVVNPENELEYTVTLDAGYLFKNGNSDKVTLSAAKGAIADALGNANESEMTETVTVKKDATAPEATKVATSTTNGKVSSFSVTFDEAVVTPDNAKISVVNSKGEILSASNVVTKAEVSKEDDKTVVFTLASDLAVDTYSFELAEGFVKDKALTANDSEEYAFDVKVTEAGQPVETSFNITSASADKNVITVDFGTKVKVTGKGSALNPSAYQINGEALPADTKVEFAKDANGSTVQSQVVITLPEGFVKANDDKAVFRVNAVQSLDNKESNQFSKVIEVLDNTAPEVESIVATNPTEITVTYSEAIQLAEVADVTTVITDEIALVDDKGASISIKAFDIVDGKLVLTVEDATKVKSLSTLTVKEAANANIVDANGVAQKAELTISK